MQASIVDVKRQMPDKIIVAVPSAPQNQIRFLSKLVDRVVTLDPGIGYLGAVGAYYDEFPQLEDNEVIRLMRFARSLKPPPPPPPPPGVSPGPSQKINTLLGEGPQ